MLSESVPGLIADYFGECVDFGMNFKMENIGPSGGQYPEGGHSDFVYGHTAFNVYINGYYSDATDLSLAATIFHEALHCQLYYWYNEAVVYHDTTLQIQLAEQYGYIFTDIFSGNNTLYNIIQGGNPTQHQAIADDFTLKMGGALLQFAQSRGINTDWSTCMDLAAAQTNGSSWYHDCAPNLQTYLETLRNAELDPYGNNANTANQSALGHPCY